MEYEELEKLWRKYDNKLDNLERLNKKLLKETLLKKPRRKINWYKFQSIYGLIMAPIIFVVAFRPRLFSTDNFNLLFVAGLIICIGVLIYIANYYLKSYRILRKVDLSNDSLIDVAKKVNLFKVNFNKQRKFSFYYSLLFFIGVLLLIWDKSMLSLQKIMFFVILATVINILRIKGGKVSIERLQKLEKELEDIEEYND